jgi:sugar-specific transcriptional regulator TrmB
MHIPFFDRLGLTKNEREIYLFLLEHGHTIASIIGKRLGMNRVTAYASLRSLKAKDLISSFQKNKVTYFEAASPEDLISLCQKRVAEEKTMEQEARDMLPQLQSIQTKGHAPILEVKGDMKYYQGLEAVKHLVNETVEEREEEQLCFGLSSLHIKDMEDEWRKYTKKRVDNNMFVRSIQPDIPEAKKYKGRDEAELRKTHLVPHKKFSAECELNICGDMIALFVTHGDKPSGMKIYHRDMAKMLRSLFELAWEKAEEYDKDA